MVYVPRGVTAVKIIRGIWKCIADNPDKAQLRAKASLARLDKIART
jgi:hypothetical protein